MTKPNQKNLPELDAEIYEVFDYYRVLHPKSNPKPRRTQKEWKLITARLQEGYSVGDLCQAIDGCHRSPFHCGENDRHRRYQSLELIMRCSDKVTQFMEYAEDDQQQPVLSEKTQRTVRAGESFLERFGEAGGEGEHN